MKKISTYLAVLLSALLPSMSVQAAGKALIVGMEATYPPFESIENGKFVGFDVDLITTIANNLGYTVVFKNMQFSSILPALNASKVDMAISGLTITDDRKKNFDSSDPYMEDNISAVIYKGSGFNTIDSLNGKKVCVQQGTTNEDWANDNMPKAELFSMDSTDQCIAGLNTKDFAAAILNTSQVKPYINKNPNLESPFTVSTGDKLAIFFHKRSPYTKAFNDELKKLIDNGTVDKLIKKWM